MPSTGSNSVGAVTQPGGLGTAFTVSAGHAYAIAGSFTVMVSIADVGGQTASTSFTVTVQPSIFVLNPSVSGGSFSCQILGIANTAYVIEASTNLLNWTPIKTNSSPVGIISFSDPINSHSLRYYRVKKP